jgi:hypothetical protein
MPSALRAALFAVLLLGVGPTPVQADWLLIPYACVRFGGSTALLVLDSAVDEKTYTIGASVVRLGSGFFGIEGDVGLTPGFFEQADASLVRSSVASAGANVVVTLPLSVTRESLRPYVVIGGGWLRATARDFSGTFPIQSTMPAVTLGGGAMGFFSDATGIRFDLRLHRSLGAGDDFLVRPGHRLRFWRGTVGIVRRF